MEYTLSHENARKACIAAISALPLATHAVSIKRLSARRSDAQNRLAFTWFKYVSSQTGETPQEVRQYCKLHHGVPILSGNTKFREHWQKISVVLSYEDQLAAMELLPVTRLFSVPQFTAFLEAMEHDYTTKGVPLPHPDQEYFTAMGLI